MSALSGRFEKVETTCMGGKVRNRWQGPGDERSDSPGDFLARLWTLFGPPGEVDEGHFSYYLRDRDTGLCFDAYSGASGPAYAGAPRDMAALAPVLDAFDQLLDATDLSDCRLEFTIGHVHYRMGAVNGRAFDEAEPV